ncbi:MAG: hypothetical protein ACE5FD_06960 [Anaerolineae bacterium]
MRAPYTQLYVHMVWATWDRLPLITKTIEPRLYAAIATNEITPGQFFKWQGAYGTFTLRKSEVPQVKAYILNQKQHYAENDLYDEWEQGMLWTT